jgi:hypothetical protein
VASTIATNASPPERAPLFERSRDSSMLSAARFVSLNGVREQVRAESNKLGLSLKVRRDPNANE